MAKKVKKAQSGKEVETVKNFYEEYINSPKYKERLSKQGYINPNKVIKDRLTNLKATRAIFNPYVDPEYHFEDNSDKYLTYIERPNFPKHSVLSHEYSHAVGALEANQDTNKNLNLNSKEIKELQKRNKAGTVDFWEMARNKKITHEEAMLKSHDQKASENKAYIDALRFNLKKDKIYDTGTQEFNKTLLNKAKKLYKNDNVIVPLFENFKDEDIIYLMNNIAMDTKNDSSVQKAQNGGIIKDNRGQWAHPGKVTQIDSNQITMKGVNYPVLGVSDTNDVKLMFPGQDYKFEGNTVTEFPMNKKKAQNGTLIPLDVQKNNLMLKNALQAERAQKRESVRMSLKKQFPEDIQYSEVNKGMIDYYKTEPIEYQNLDINLLDKKRKDQLLKTYKYNQYIDSNFKSGGKIKGKKKKAQEGFSMSDINPTDAAEIQLENNIPTDIMGGFTSTSPNYNASQPRNNSNRVGMILQGANAINYGFNSPGNSETGGPSEGQKIVGQMGPWGSLISSVSQIGTKIGNEIGGAGGNTLSAMANPSASLTNKDFSTGEKIWGAINPIYAGLKNNQVKKKKKEKENRLNDIVKQASELKDPEAEKRRYVRPEDMILEPNSVAPTYGTGTNYLKNGGNIPYAMGGELKTYEGGGMEIMSQNPYLPDNGETVMFKGKSHKEGGIDMQFGKSKVEVEGGEPAVKLNDGDSDSLVIFGNMKIPKYGVAELNDPKAKNKKFKNYIAELSKLEDKQNEVVNKGVKLVNDTPILDSFDKLKVSSGKAMIEGGNMKLKQIANKKQIAANVQNAILETAKELNLNSDELAKGNIKKLTKREQKAQEGLTIPRSKMTEYEQYGYHLDPEDQNRMFRDLMGNPITSTISVPEPGKGSEEFNKAFADARRKQLKEFTWRGKPYTTDMYQGKTQTITNPGTSKRDYIYLQDDPTQQMDQQLANTPQEDTAPNMMQVEKQRFPWMALANTVLPYFRPTNQIPLDQSQLSGEMFALASNQVEPVKAQLYEPLLEQVSDISLQDQLNANQADFNSILRLTADNPAAQASLAGQKYQANTNVLAEQFRLNQTQKMGVYNRNRATINDAKLKNLGILDTQYVRQSQAKSNTKAVAQQAINSISDKIAKNKLENRTLGVYENLYNYRYDNQGRAWNMNPLVDFTSMVENAVSDGLVKLDDNGKVVVSESKVKRDKNGIIENSTDTQRVTDYPDNWSGSRRSYGNGGIVKSLKNY